MSRLFSPVVVAACGLMIFGLGRLSTVLWEVPEPRLHAHVQDAAFERGVNQCLEVMMLHDLELGLATGQPITWGERANAVRERLGVAVIREELPHG